MPVLRLIWTASAALTAIGQVYGAIPQPAEGSLVQGLMGRMRKSGFDCRGLQKMYDLDLECGELEAKTLAGRF